MNRKFYNKKETFFFNKTKKMCTIRVKNVAGVYLLATDGVINSHKKGIFNISLF